VLPSCFLPRRLQLCKIRPQYVYTLRRRADILRGDFHLVERFVAQFERNTYQNKSCVFSGSAPRGLKQAAGKAISANQRGMRRDVLQSHKDLAKDTNAKVTQILEMVQTLTTRAAAAAADIVEEDIKMDGIGRARLIDLTFTPVKFNSNSKGSRIFFSCLEIRETLMDYLAPKIQQMPKKDDPKFQGNVLAKVLDVFFTNFILAHSVWGGSTR
jgi:hypothetical protein